MNNRTACQLLLHLQNYLLRSDDFAAVFHVILRHKTVVLAPLFGEEVYRIGFLVEVRGPILINIK